MKLFGKDLFEKKPDAELYDFAQHGLIRGTDHYAFDAVLVTSDSDLGTKKKPKAKKEPVTKTPKEVYKLKQLDLETFTIDVTPEYVEQQVAILEKKRDLLPVAKKIKRNDNMYVTEDSYGASKYGRLEVESLIERLNNRKKYAENKKFFDKYPYTTSARINEVLKEHSHLRSKRVEEFIPDMPEEAIDAMTEYKETVKNMTGKLPVFYIIADKKDFGEIDKKRDPILLAQSPFSLAWQVLGAWDEEMVYLGDL